ncbi:MAG: hypothetical protein ACLUEK_09125 [Oscillospiraceae bacterium]
MVLTIAATGSETSDSAVLTNTATGSSAASAAEKPPALRDNGP